jgi:hypothetical protein
MLLAPFLFWLQVVPAMETQTVSSCSSITALKRVAELPETKAWADYIQKKNAGLKSGECLLVSDEKVPDRYKGTFYWTVEFTEFDTEPTIPPYRWETFLVRTKDCHIFIHDLNHNEILSLERWRKLKQPMKRITTGK